MTTLQSSLNSFPVFVSLLEMYDYDYGYDLPLSEASITLIEKFEEVYKNQYIEFNAWMENLVDDPEINDELEGIYGIPGFYNLVDSLVSGNALKTGYNVFLK